MQALPSRRAALWAALAVSASVLAACSSGHNTMMTPPPPSPPKLEDSFGAGFGNLFRASANSEPLKPLTSDVNAIDPSAAPTLLH